MKKIIIKRNSAAFHLIMYIGAAESLAATLFLPQSKWQALFWCPKYSTYRSAIYRLLKSGIIEIIKEKNHRLLKLTKKGVLQKLFIKAQIPKPEKWDGKWRMIIFDIPEETKRERNHLRKLLLINNFKKLQQSVYICPHPLNRDAVAYLKEAGLMPFIRLGRLEELDDDSSLKKSFGL